MEEISESKCNCQEGSTTCTTISTQLADVSLPIKLKPFAVLGEVETSCCKEPTITVRPNCNCCCDLVITQSICITIPIEYGANVETDEISVCCKRTNPPCSPCK